MYQFVQFFFLLGFAAWAIPPAETKVARGRSEQLDIPGIGSIIGQEGSSANLDMPIYEFLGIPYATKPERFKAPTSYATWSEPLDATVPAPGCPDLLAGLPILRTLAETVYPDALNMRSFSRHENPGLRSDRDPEDCLTLDIYTPKVSEDANLPVFFYVHGGAFVLGDSSMASGGYLLEHAHMVLVSVQYRLGPMGYLAAEEADAPGNGALHDLHWGLQWVRDHIRYFGGNPEHIVVGGVSAGAALSGLLSVSPLTRDMVVGAALFSGGATSPWTVDEDPWRSARGVGVFARCLDPTTLRDCLRRRSPLELYIAWGAWTVYEKYFRNHGMGGVIPSVNPNDAILPNHPVAEMKSDSFKGKPMLIGVTKHEGTFVFAQLDLFYMKARNLTEDQRTLDHELGDLLMEFSDVEDNLNVLGDAVKRLYFSRDRIGNYTAMYEGLIDFTGAGFFKGPAQRMARLNADAGGRSYLYSFDYALEGSSSGGESSSTVPHGSDQYFLFPSNKVISENDRQVIETYSRLVAKFVTTLEPVVDNVQWNSHSFDSDYYVSINLQPQQKHEFSNEFYVMETERQEVDETSSENPDTTEEPKDTPSTPTVPVTTDGTTFTASPAPTVTTDDETSSENPDTTEEPRDTPSTPTVPVTTDGTTFTASPAPTAFFMASLILIIFQ